MKLWSSTDGKLHVKLDEVTTIYELEKAHHAWAPASSSPPLNWALVVRGDGDYIAITEALALEVITALRRLQ